MSDIIFDYIKEERRRQVEGVELIASENFVSQSVLDAMGTVLTNKYAEGYPGKRYYGGCEVVDKVESTAQARLKKLFGAEYANVQPHSGAQANAAVFLSCLNAGDTVLGFDLSHGGHLTHGSPVNFSGKLYNPVFYGVDKDSELIDLEKVRATAHEHRPKMIICGASAYSRDWDYKEFRKIADEVGAILMADIAHPAGLIAKVKLNDPLPHCHVVTSTTHKTLRGPRGGIIMIGEDMANPWGKTTKKGNLIKMSAIINSGVFPGTQGGPLQHVIAAKAVAFEEALDDSFDDYVTQIIKNTRVMAEAFQAKDYRIISGGTDNHLILVNLNNKGMTGKEAEDSLGKAGITVNKNMIPFDKHSPFVTSGIRLGAAAVTTRGLEEKDMERIVDWIDDALMNRGNEERLKKILSEVNEFMRDLPLHKK